MCLCTSLLQWFENASLLEQCKEGKCCSSCNGINKDKLISWLLGAKRDWITNPEIVAHIDKSTTITKGSTPKGTILNHPWWQRNLR